MASLIHVMALIGMTALLQRGPTPAFSGRVVADDGKPIAGVQVWTTGFLSFGGDTQTDADGRFSMKISTSTLPGDRPTARFSRSGYSPLTVVLPEARNDYVFTLHRTDQPPWQVPLCTQQTQFGGSDLSFMAFVLPKGTKTRREQDVDYSTQGVQFKKAWMIYGQGPTWSSGFPPNLSSYVQNVSELTERDVRFNEDVSGVEYRGKRTDGTYFRFIGMLGQTADYDHVTPQAAAFFDGIMDTMCQRR
jgi:hypothetical protein